MHPSHTLTFQHTTTSPPYQHPSLQHPAFQHPTCTPLILSHPTLLTFPHSSHYHTPRIATPSHSHTAYSHIPHTPRLTLPRPSHSHTPLSLPHSSHSHTPHTPALPLTLPQAVIKANNMEIHCPHQCFINGQFVDATLGKTYDTINPTDESVSQPSPSSVSPQLPVFGGCKLVSMQDPTNHPQHGLLLLEAIYTWSGIETTCRCKLSILLAVKTSVPGSQP